MDKKISQLTAATTPLTGAEELAIVQSGVTKKTTIEDVKGYKVYTALMSQSGGDDPQSFDNGTLTIGKTYYINNDSPGMDFTNVGAPNNNLGTFFVATGTTPNSWGANEGLGNDTLAYNNGAPVVTVLENTIGNIWFTYVADGNYNVNSDGLFIQNKTAIFLSNIGSLNGDMFLILSSGYSQNIIDITTLDSPTTPAIGVLYNTPIEIRVYN